MKYAMMFFFLLAVVTLGSFAAFSPPDALCPCGPVCNCSPACEKGCCK